jgi:hypothetical protein
MIEEIYKDFTEKLLPKIQEGLVISKEYFLDLFGRYVKYLIISDIFMIFFLIVAIIILGILAKFFYVQGEKDSWYDPGWIIGMIFSVAGVITCIIGLSIKANHLIQDIYIPEVRIIQEIKPYK